MKGGWAAAIVLVVVGLVSAYFALGFYESDDQGFKDFCGESKVVQDEFAQFYKDQKNYPAYTLDELQQMGVFDGDARSYWVYFTPFSSKTPDSDIVLRLGYGPFALLPQLCDFSWTKYDLTHDPDPGQTPLKDHLEDAMLKQTRALANERSGTRIFSTCTWLDGVAHPRGYGELVIWYGLPGGGAMREMHYDLWQTGDTWSVGEAKRLH